MRRFGEYFLELIWPKTQRQSKQQRYGVQLISKTPGFTRIVALDQGKAIEKCCL